MTKFNILLFYSDFHRSDLFFYYFRTVSKDMRPYINNKKDINMCYNYRKITVLKQKDLQQCTQA